MFKNHSLLKMWDELALMHLSRSFGMAMGPTKVILAFFTIVILSTIGFVMDSCTKSVVVKPDRTLPREFIHARTNLIIEGSELEVYIDDHSKTPTFIAKYDNHAMGQGVFVTLWSYFGQRFNNATLQLLRLDTTNIYANIHNVFENIWLCVRAVVWAFRFHTLYSLIYFTMAIIILCLSGGAICRCGALELSQSERPGLGEAFQFSREHFKNYLYTFLVPTSMVFLFSILVVFIGFLGNITGFGELLIALSFIFLLVLGFVMMLLIFATSAGAILMFPSVAFEGTTGFDAIGRSFSYVLTKPIWMVFYTFVTVIFGTLFYLTMRLLVFSALWITYQLLSIGMALSPTGIEKLSRIWTEPTFLNFLQPPGGPYNWSESIAAVLIDVIMLTINSLVLSMVFTFMLSGACVIYALMRRKVDNIRIETIHIHLEQIIE